jgi:class 3 adenylate cyclase/tetratricopeptide (TPR) repeat protein
MRFCGDCGASLRLTTIRIEAPALTVPRAALHLGEAEGERKQLTVLFADVHRSMQIQEHLDVESWARIVERFVDILARGVRRFGGTVDKFTGDGIMALFGAPLALEDHARRACHAAWHMTREVRAYADELRRSEGVDLEVRIGLNSGEVVLVSVGEDVRLDPTALGHAVGLAQRMEALAVPGSVYLTVHTARMVEGWFRLRELGPMRVRGAREPLGVFVLEGPEPSRPAGTGGRPTARFVGRGSELSRLEEALARAAEGHARVVGVVGEPGVGKSRLCDEFARSVIARGITVHRTAGVSHGRDVPLLAVLAFFRPYFGITEADSAAQARERISDRLLALDPAFLDDLPLFFDFLEVPDPQRPAPQMGTEVRMQRILQVVRRLTARRSERELMVFVFEDLHWFDPQSEAFTERVIESFPGTRTLVVANFRPEFFARWMRHSYYEQLCLLPLSADAVSEMVRDLLGEDASLASFPAYLIERTGGNPFFVEEVVRALVEDGTLAGRPGSYRLTRSVETAGLPASVHSVLAARIDRLAAEHKPVLQSAAVIGRTFSQAVLARVVGTTPEGVSEALSALCAAELLQEAQRYPLVEYRFWHALTQEVAYGTLLAGRRARLHAAVAEALIEHDADRLDEEAAVLAWHWERAGRPLEAARWSLRAGAFALRSDLGEALRRWRKAVDLLCEVEESTEALEIGVRARIRLLQFGGRAGITPAEIERIEVGGRVLAERLGDPGLSGTLVVVSGSARYWGGDLTGGLAGWLEAAHRGEAVDDPDVKAAMCIGASFGFTATGPLSEGAAWGDRGIEACAGNPECGYALIGYSILARTHQCRAGVLARMGRLLDAREDVEQALRLVRPRGEPETLSWALALVPLLAWLSGDRGDTSAAVVDAVKVAEESGNPASLVLALEAAALSHLMAGRAAEAANLCERALALAHEKRSGLFATGSVLSHLALAQLAVGDCAAAATTADVAVETSHGQGARVHECLALLTRAHVAAQRSAAHAGMAAADLAEALRLVWDTGALTYEPFIREEMGRLHGEGRELREALRLYTAIGATGHARRLAVELAGRRRRRFGKGWTERG